MNQEIIIEILKEVPSLAILAYLFKVITSQQRTLIEQLQAREDKATSVISENSKVIGGTNVLMSHTREALEDLKIELIKSNGKSK